MWKCPECPKFFGSVLSLSAHKRWCQPCAGSTRAMPVHEEVEITLSNDEGPSDECVHAAPDATYVEKSFDMFKDYRRL